MSRQHRRLPSLLAILVVAALVVAGVRLTRRSVPEPELSPEEFMGRALATLVQHEEQEAQKYWGPELNAQQHGRFVEDLWDAINASSNKLGLVATVAIPSIQLAEYRAPERLPHGIGIRRPTGAGQQRSHSDWSDFLARRMAEGWDLAQCEFRHNAFTPPTGGKPASSKFYFSAHLVNARTQARAIVEGDLVLHWREGAAQPTLAAVDASALELRLRHGAPAFRQVLNEEVVPMEGSFFIDPLIVWDLDKDGFSEIILAAKNVVYRRQTNGMYEAALLCEDDPRLIFTAILGDFTGDGALDFLAAKFDGLFLHEGTPEGKFPKPARMVWAAQPRLKYAQALTMGDIDGDGDLDLFLGQYKLPYDRGQMPFPYFDANDGHPSFLLLNDGKGNFTDVTQKNGLGAKRNRRVYSASLIDLDWDQDLDLLVISDFAGLDAFENDGTGRFKEATGKWFPDRHALGMAHAFADFNLDGWLDIVMIGMNSPVADRLEHLRLNRPYDVPDAGMRAKITYGNRLYFGQPDGTYKQTALSDSVARTGWSWGCAAADFDNDGFPDLYIANGHETDRSVREYEPHFWLHDIYAGNSQENALLQAYFSDKFSRTRGVGFSYGGHERNRMFLNRGGTNFVEVAHLFGVALPKDSRTVAAADLNRDGKLDLIVTTFESSPKLRQTIRIWENQLAIEPVAHELVLAEPGWTGRSIRVDGKNSRAIPLVQESYRTQVEPTIRARDAAWEAPHEIFRSRPSK